MKYWDSRADDDPILISDPCHLYKNKSHSSKPSVPPFHYSSTPWHAITVIRLRRTDLAKWPGFRSLNRFYLWAPVLHANFKARLKVRL